jgi:serine/threonine protein phosphatase PrpC
MIVSIAGLTDVGESRDHNEDGFLVFDMALSQELLDPDPAHALDQRPLLVAVSDGMGGALAGEVASAMTLDVLREHATEAMAQLGGLDSTALESWLAQGIHEANRRVREAARNDPSLEGMGATATAGLVFPGAMVLAHVGDSRAYHLREGQLRQVTTDHTFVGHLVAQGHLTPEEAHTHEHRHVLLQAVGVNEVLKTDSLTVILRPDDRLLLCSDGLYDLVSDEAIVETLAADGQEPLAQCRALVTAANSLGGFDNTTVIILHVGGE